MSGPCIQFHSALFLPSSPPPPHPPLPLFPPLPPSLLFTSSSLKVCKVYQQTEVCPKRDYCVLSFFIFSFFIPSSTPSSSSSSPLLLLLSLLQKYARCINRLAFVLSVITVSTRTANTRCVSSPNVKCVSNGSRASVPLWLTLLSASSLTARKNIDPNSRTYTW